MTLRVACVALAMLTALIRGAPAQPNSSYDLRWQALSAGSRAGQASGGYVMCGTVAQTGVRASTSAPAGYALVGGFWPGLAKNPEVVFRDGLDGVACSP